MSSILESILDHYPDETFVAADGFEEALIGLEPRTFRLVYSVSKAMEILLRTMSEDEAREHFHFNVLDCGLGEQTPIWCDDEY